MLHANDRVVRLIESARSCIEDAERPRSSPTGDATAAENRIRSAKRIEADPSRVEELRPPLSAERENATRLEKKLPLLRKEQREPRQVYYLLISLDLSKVGVHREVRGERGRQRHLRVDATLPAEKTIAQSRPERVMLGGDSASERVWHQRDVAGSLQDAETHEIALGEQMIKSLRSTPAAPERLLVFPPNEAPNVETEHGARTGLEPQCTKRNAKPCNPSARVARHGDVPDAIPILIEDIDTAELRVPHRPVWIGLKDER